MSGRSYRLRFRNRESRRFNALSGVPWEFKSSFRFKIPVRLSYSVNHRVLNESVTTTDLVVLFDRKIDFN